MPNPQPTQMEQRMELADKVAAAMQRARDEIGATEQQRIAFGYAEAAMRSVLETTRPTADLGDDGELVERLRRAEAYIRIANRSSLHADTVEQAADRLILYREAREQLSNALLSGTLSMTERVVCVHFESRADAEEMFVTLEGAALTHVENEGQ